MAHIWTCQSRAARRSASESQELGLDIKGQGTPSIQICMSELSKGHCHEFVTPTLRCMTFQGGNMSHAFFRKTTKAPLATKVTGGEHL